MEEEEQKGSVVDKNKRGNWLWVTRGLGGGGRMIPHAGGWISQPLVHQGTTSSDDVCASRLVGTHLKVTRLMGGTKEK